MVKQFLMLCSLMQIVHPTNAIIIISWPFLPWLLDIQSSNKLFCWVWQIAPY
jgi:hypothetical protein